MPAKTPDDYMREMMELYSRSSSVYEPKPPVKPVPVEPVPENVESVPENVGSIPDPVGIMPESVENVPEYAESIPKNVENNPESVPKPLPESVEPMSKFVESVPETVEPAPEDIEPMPENVENTPELILNPVPAEKSSGETPEEAETSFGWIQVTARTAGNALPLEGASVLILKKRGTDNELLMTLVTDNSGSTPKVRLPAPPVGDIPSQPYSTYEIRAFLPGYSRMESASVPVFSGITSVQPFELIPLPEGSGSDHPAVINQNTEPKF